jgi:hypothetical protein
MSEQPQPSKSFEARKKAWTERLANTNVYMIGREEHDKEMHTKIDAEAISVFSQALVMLTLMSGNGQITVTIKGGNVVDVSTTVK